jgi:glycosyltransferase involved in cell wall biosynthesis
MEKVRLSVIIPAKNESKNIVPVLNALKGWVDEVYVVDSQSTDGMPEVVAEIAKDSVAKVECVQFHFNGSYPKKKNWALDNLPIRNEWVLIVDADEVIPPALAEEIAEKVANPDADGYYLHFLYMFLGRPIRHCGYASLRVLRLFRHKLGRYEKMPTNGSKNVGDCEAHEHIILDGKVGECLKTSVEHYAYPTIHSWVEKHNRYSSWEAELYDGFMKGEFDEGVKSMPFGRRVKRRLKRIHAHLPCRAFVRFCYHYIFRAGFLDGKPGFIFCVLLSFYDFLCNAKVWEKKRVVSC